MENSFSVLDVLVQCQESDYLGNYRPSQLVSLLSDLATTNAIEVGIWHKDLANCYGFILIKETVVLKRPIKVGELIHLYTRAAEVKRIQFVRNYWFNDDQGNEIGAAHSLWTLLDIQKRRIIKPDKAGITLPEIKPYDYPLNEYHEIRRNLDLVYVMERTVLYSDVDVNQHLNNSRYIEWVFDALPFALFKDRYFKEFSVHYKKEMVPNATTKIYRYLDDEYVKVVFKSVDDEVYFEFGGFLEDM